MLGEIGASEQLYAFGGDGFAAQQTVGGSTDWALLDGLGSVRHLTDGSGNTTLSRTYDAWGVVKTNTGAGVTRFGFTGELQNVGSGLTYLRARHYLAGLGRFAQRDQIFGDMSRGQSTNRHIYTENNPANYVDSNGHIACHVSSDACKTAAARLSQTAKSIQGQVRAGNIKPVEGLAQLSDRAMELYEGDISGYMWGMTNVLLGVDPSAIAIEKVGFFSPAKYPEANPYNNPYWVGYDFLDAPTNSPSLGDNWGNSGDWNPDFYDGTAGQARHFWFYAALAYYGDFIEASVGNFFHDPPAGVKNTVDQMAQLPTPNSKPLFGERLETTGSLWFWQSIGRFWSANSGGASQPDYNLGISGSSLGASLSKSIACVHGICVKNETNPSEWIRNNLKRTP